ncbi:DUF6873 family GME fold protein [Faecalispora anaeroviscerum]|uniref:DUF6873 family GME fold protein n=1 Tax=Faecalispora anaeroviscerum TaxID=2991836 RepID=UPI0024B88925|nr:hypothetical protein [Faecalispora anaeroviscerum]
MKMKSVIAPSERFVEIPNLPSAEVTTVIAADIVPEVTAALQSRGIRMIAPPINEDLPEPINRHADLQCVHLKGKSWLVVRSETELQQRLKEEGAEVQLTEWRLGQEYPADIRLNALLLHKQMFGKLEELDPALQKACDFAGVHKFPVRQGYTNCSVAIVSEKAIITADSGIAQAAERHGIRVLKISAGNIRLPGYEYGFIGGCCGLISQSILVFTGALNLHPDGLQIRRFVEAQKKQVLELTQNSLIDMGGILPMKERV